MPLRVPATAENLPALTPSWCAGVAQVAGPQRRFPHERQRHHVRRHPPVRDDANGGGRRHAAARGLRARCEIGSRGWPRTGRPARPEGRPIVTSVFRPEDAWGCSRTGPAPANFATHS